METFKQDVQEIKQDVKELIKQGAMHNELLRQHEARSIELQLRQDKLDSRLSPVEKQYGYFNIVLGALGTILISLTVQFLVRVLF